jgi:hypothetical protein
VPASRASLYAENMSASFLLQDSKDEEQEKYKLLNDMSSQVTNH